MVADEVENLREVHSYPSENVSCNMGSSKSLLSISSYVRCRIGAVTR